MNDFFKEKKEHFISYGWPFILLIVGLLLWSVKYFDDLLFIRISFLFGMALGVSQFAGAIKFLALLKRDKKNRLVVSLVLNGFLTLLLVSNIVWIIVLGINNM